MSTPEISVVMAVRDGEKYLREAVDSVLAQTFPDFEAIIVDDGSRDQTSAILDSYGDPRILRLRNPRPIGAAAARNRAVALARGRYIANLDADDVVEPERLALQHKCFEADRDLGLLGSAYTIIAGDGSVQPTGSPPFSDTAIRWYMLFYCPFIHSSVMYRGEVYRRCAPGYLDLFAPAEDYELWARMKCLAKMANLKESLVKYRVHDSNISSKRFREQQTSSRLVSFRQIRRVLAKEDVGLSEAGVLRHWFLNPPSGAELIPERPGRLFLELIEAFAARERPEPAELSAIRARYAVPIATALERTRD